jgi:hypothetical protein
MDIEVERPERLVEEDLAMISAARWRALLHADSCAGWQFRASQRPILRSMSETASRSLRFAPPNRCPTSRAQGRRGANTVGRGCGNTE